MPQSTDLIQLYYWPTPNGWKISIMLEECGIPYDVRLVNIGRGEQFTPEFLAIAPNNRSPAIVDPRGPDGGAISIFESGAILQYLSRKSGRFGGDSERERVSIAEWLFWQVGGLGPMAGQANHFRNYAPEKVAYGIDRYTNEVHRLFGVMNRRLSDNPYLAGNNYSIADMASVGWARSWERMGQDIAEFPHFKRWLDKVSERPAVKRGLAVSAEMRGNLADDKEAQKILFGQRAR